MCVRGLLHTENELTVGIYPWNNKTIFTQGSLYSWVDVHCWLIFSQSVYILQSTVLRNAVLTAVLWSQVSPERPMQATRAMKTN